MNSKNLNLIKKSFNENKNSHAFLVETNNIYLGLVDLKKLIFDINEISDSELNEENIPDIKIIKPDGKEIKREQVTEILDEFKTYPVVLRHRYYIVMESDAMNQSAANTILKFLEEPEGDVIGFFLTSNKGAMISTISSRCQHYKLQYEKNIDINDHMAEEFINNMVVKEVYKRILFLNSFFSKERIDNIKYLREIREYVFKNRYNEDIGNLKLLVKRVRLLDNVIERVLKNANQELVILDLARKWK